MKLFNLGKSSRLGSKSNGTFPVTLTGVFSSISVSVSEHTASESWVINNSYFIVLLVSDDVINTLEFLEEDLDHLIDNFDVISKSVNFFHVEVSVGLKFNFSLFNGTNGVFPGSLSFSFHVLSKNEIVLKFGSISHISVEFDLEDMGFFFRFLNESNGISSGSDFSLDKIGHRLMEMDNKSIKSDHKFTNNGLFGIVSVGGMLFKNLSTSGIVISIITDFFSSSSSFIHIVITFSEGKEVGKSLLFEEVGVSRKFVERTH